MPHFKAFGMMNLQYVIRICHKINNKSKMIQLKYKLHTIFLSETDVTTPIRQWGAGNVYLVVLSS